MKELPQALLELLSARDRDELTAGIKSLILSSVEKSFEDYTSGEYCFDPRVLDELFADALAEAQEEIKEIFKTKIVEELQKKFLATFPEGD